MFCKKLRLLSIYVSCIVVLTGLTGCIFSTTKTPASIVSKILNALTQVKSYQLDTDFTDGPGPGSTEWKATRVIDVSDKEMSMNMAITSGSLLTTDEEYFMDGQGYLKTVAEANSPPTWGWSARALVDDVWNAQIEIPFLTELLKTPTKFSPPVTAQLNDIDCYVVTITPSAQAAVDFLVTLDEPGGPDVGGMLWGGGGGILERTDTYNFGAVELWIDKDTYLPVKVTVNLDFRGYLNPENPNILEQGYQGELDFSNYNQPVSIQVPQDALNAQNVGN
jgi:hypothetical protein